MRLNMTTDIYGTNIPVPSDLTITRLTNHDLTVVAITARPFGPHATMHEKLEHTEPDKSIGFCYSFWHETTAASRGIQHERMETDPGAEYSC